MSLITPPEAVYPDANTATASIQAHAKDHDYTFCIYNSGPHRLVLTCDRAGKYNSKGRTLIHTALNNNKILALRSVDV
jgi:hypothetical protein